MKPLQISPETAKMLAEKLKIPIEHLMHMPQHILIQKLTQLAKEDDQKDSISPKDTNSAE